MAPSAVTTEPLVARPAVPRVVVVPMVDVAPATLADAAASFVVVTADDPGTVLLIAD